MTTTAEKVYNEILEMPVKEREKLFTVIARHGFEKEVYTHDEVFDDVRQSPFTIKEASEYLEVAEITVRWKVSGNPARCRKWYMGSKTVYEKLYTSRFIPMLAPGLGDVHKSNG